MEICGDDKEGKQVLWLECRFNQLLLSHHVYYLSGRPAESNTEDNIGSLQDVAERLSRAKHETRVCEEQNCRLGGMWYTNTAFLRNFLSGSRDLTHGGQVCLFSS